MKYILFIFLLASTFTSCVREKCWKCNVYITTDPNIKPNTVGGNTTKCKMTKGEIKKWVKGSTKQWKSWNSALNDSVTYYQIANCE